MHSTTFPELGSADREFIGEAVAYLEKPSFLIRLANLAGKPVEVALSALPTQANEMIAQATTKALGAALRWAIRSLPGRAVKHQTLVDAAKRAAREAGGSNESTGRPETGEPPGVVDEIEARADGSHRGPEPAHEKAPGDAPGGEGSASATPVAHGRGGFSLSPALHTMMAATTGAVGGAFGLGGLAFETPATTTIMLRSIAAAAGRQGADLDDPATRLQCLAVLSLGAPAASEMESAYFTSRVGLALAVRESAQFLATHSAQEVAAAMSKGTAPALLRLVGMIASRFQIVITEKIAAQAAPIAGAAAGALINAAFTDHFNRVANYHFGILRLEKIYGAPAVHAVYEEARRRLGPRHDGPAHQ